MRILILTCAILFIPALGFAQNTLHVPSQYPTIQGAINAALNGDTVLVDSGTYVENINYLGKAITVVSSHGPEVTVIDGGFPASPDYCSVVIFMNREGLDSVIDGFTLMNGSGTVYTTWGHKGGGIYCEDTSPKIINNIITMNTAYYGAGIVTMKGAAWIENNLIFGNTAKGKLDSAGGGIDLSLDSEATVINNTIYNNSAEGAGGIMCYFASANARILGNTVSGNSALYGGGFYLFKSSPMISGNMIHGNSSSNGGGIYCGNNSSPVILNNILHDNSANLAAGINCIDSSNVTITGNTLFGNNAKYEGGGIIFNNSTSDVTNTIFWNNSAPSGPELKLILNSTVTISYSNVQGGQGSMSVTPGSTLNWGSGMIETDPLFVNEAKGDFHLPYTSPCKDSGDNSTVPPGLLEDFEGDSRICYGTVDMGADECYTHLYYTGDATPGGTVDLTLVGFPGISPVGLFLSIDVYDPPLPSMWGDWYLAWPWFGPIDLGTMPSPDGVMVIPGLLPGIPPGPYTIYMQAIIGAELTNLNKMCVN